MTTPATDDDIKKFDRIGHDGREGNLQRIIDSLLARINADGKRIAELEAALEAIHSDAQVVSKELPKLRSNIIYLIGERDGQKRRAALKAVTK